MKKSIFAVFLMSFVALIACKEQSNDASIIYKTINKEYVLIKDTAQLSS